MVDVYKYFTQQVLKNMKPKLKNLQDQAVATLQDEIYWTVYRSYKPVLYGKRILKDGTQEKGRTWQLLNSVTASPLKIEGLNNITFTVYLDPGKMEHFSGYDPSKKVYIGKWINDGHSHPTLTKPAMFHQYPARKFIESAIDRLNREINQEIKDLFIVEIKRLG